MPSRKRTVLPVAGEPEEDVASWPTGRLLSVAARLVESRFDDVLAGHDLTHAGLIVLHHLQAQPRTQRELAVLCRVTDQTMSRTTERLERTGLVTRGVDPDDRRRTIAQITDAGGRTLARARREAGESQLLLGVVDDYEHFRAQLVKIIRHGSED